MYLDDLRRVAYGARSVWVCGELANDASELLTL
jgi:hypothetical protein